MFIAIIFLLFVSFFFSASETALTATNKMRLQTRANNGDARSKKLLKLVSKPGEFLTTILIGNNIANIVLPTLVTTIAIEQGYHVGVATAIVTVLIIVFTEITPKSIAASFPERIALLVYPIIRLFVVLFKPLTILLNKMTGTITKALSKGETENVSVSKEELRAIVDIADSEGMFQKEESYRIKGFFDFHELNVKDVLKTPRIEIVAIPRSANYEQVREVALENRYTRYPVYDGDIDNIIGVFHAKNLIQWSTELDKPFSSLVESDPLIVYEFHSIDRVLRQMTKEKKHMAIVLDEYGGTEGIVTHEDIVETMLGLEIEDEFDLEDDTLVEKLTETEMVCDGKMTLHQLNNLFDTEIPEEEDVLAAYLLKEFNQFPQEGEVIERDNLTFRIMEVEGRMISKVQIIK